MQTLAAQLLNAAHALNQDPIASVSVNDPRIRGWYRSDNTSPLNYPFDAILGKTGPTLIRIQADESVSAGFRLQVALSGAAPTFGPATAFFGRWNFSGLALFTDPLDGSSPARVDAYYINVANPPLLRYTTSAGVGDYLTWSATANVHGDHVLIDTQRTNARPQLAVAGWSGTPNYYPFLFYTSTSSTDLTRGTSLVFYDGRPASGNNHRLDLGLSIPGYNTGSTSSVLPITGLGAFQSSSTDFACVLTINSPRGEAQSGIYIVWYRDGFWSEPLPISIYQPPLDGNSSYTISNPRMQVINGVYWVTALETITVPGLSKPTNPKTVSHLLAIRSTDGIHWHSDGLFLAGTDGIGDGYWTGVQSDPTIPYTNSFIISTAQNDLANNKLLTTAQSGYGNGSRVYMVGYGKLWQLNNGVTSLFTSTPSIYTANTLDLSAKVTDFSITLPNGQAGTAMVNIQNPVQATDEFLWEEGDQVLLEAGDDMLLEDSVQISYNNSRILRHGSLVWIQAGYDVASVDYWASLFTGRVDEVRQDTELTLGGGAKSSIQLSCKDVAMDNLDNWVTPLPLEYSSSIQVWVPAISDYGTTVIIQGNWQVNASGGYMQALQPPVAPQTPVLPNLDILMTNTDRVEDGIIDWKFKFTGTLTGVTGGPTFRYKDNKNFYWVRFDGSSAKWQLFSFDGSTTGAAITAALSNALSVPAAGETWWVRVHLMHDKFVISAKPDQTTFWRYVMSDTDLTGSNRIKTDTGYMGQASLSGSPIQKTISFTQNTDGLYDITSTPETEAIKFVATGGGIINSYAVQLQVSGAPAGQVEFRILPDSAGQPDLWTNFVAGTKSIISTPQIVNNGWTTITLNSNVSLSSGATYYVAFKVTNSTNDNSSHVSVPVASTGGSGNAWSDGGSNGTSWFLIGANALYSVTLSNASGSLQLLGYALYSADLPNTLNSLSTELAVKSGTLLVRPKYDIFETFAGLNNWDVAGERGTWTVSAGTVIANNAGAGDYGFLRYKTLTFGEMVMECDMTLGGGISRGGFMLQQQSVNPLNNDTNILSYVIEFNQNTNKVNLYACLNSLPVGGVSGNLIFTSQPIVALSGGLQYRVKIQHSGKFILVWLNDWLVAATRKNLAYNTVGSTQTPIDEDFLNPHGYIGLMSFGNNNPAVIFQNLVIYELKEVKDYFVAAQNATGQQSMQELHKYDRVKYYGDYDGSLRYGYFDNTQPSGDLPYQSTIRSATKVNSNRYWVAHVRPFGDYQADRYSGYLLDQEGLRFGQKDYTDVRSDRSAYHAAAYPIRSVRELTDVYEFVASANPGIQREDRITIINTRDDTNQDYLVDSIKFDYVAGGGAVKPKFEMTVTCRKFISTTAEGAV